MTEIKPPPPLFAAQAEPAVRVTPPKPGQRCPTCSLVVPVQPRLRVGSEHPETARAAERTANKILDVRSMTVIELLKSAAVEGLTDDDIDAVTGWGHQSTTPVMHSLRASRAVAWKFDVDGKNVTRLTRKGNSARVNVLAKYAVNAALEDKPCGD